MLEADHWKDLARMRILRHLRRGTAFVALFAVGITGLSVSWLSLFVPLATVPAGAAPSATTFSITANGVKTEVSTVYGTANGVILAESGIPNHATGSVTFTNGPTTLCGFSLTGAAGEATSCTTSATLPAGDYADIGATFQSSSVGFANGSSTNFLNVDVQKATVTLVLLADGAESANVPYGTPVTMSQQIGLAPAQGTLTVIGNGNTLCSIALTGVNQADPSSPSTMCTTSATLPPGAYSIIEQFTDSDGDYVNSQSLDTVSLTVTPPPAPTVIGVSPGDGSALAGEAVTIGGTNLCHATAVYFGAVLAPILSTASDCSSITVTEPTGANGTVPVTVTTPGGVTTSPVSFTYIGPGYWQAATDGGVFAFGSARFLGSVPGVLKSGQSLNAPIVAMASTPDKGGYWLFAADGGVFAFGDADFYGSVPGVLKPGQVLNKPIVAAEATPDGRGYREFAADGGVFDFGDAQFAGSLPGQGVVLSRPIDGAVSSPIGQGYWLVAGDGGVFSFGNAEFHGAAVGTATSNVVAMAVTPNGGGYWIFTAGGQVIAEGNAAANLGGAIAPSAPIVYGQGSSTGNGYWLFGSDGSVYPIGDASPEGSLAGLRLNARIAAAIGFGSTPLEGSVKS
jgi:IPT/TIG domain